MMVGWDSLHFTFNPPNDMPLDVLHLSILVVGWEMTSQFQVSFWELTTAYIINT